jgi:CBS domain-containing protein
MLIKDILRTKSGKGAGAHGMITLKPDRTVEEAARILSEKKIGLLVVVDGKGPLAGVLSERDVVRAVGKHGAAALATKVSALMTTADMVRTCKLSDHPHDVMGAMTRGGFRHMPVVENNKLEGLVSSTDIFRYLTEQANPQEQALLWSKISWV